MYKTHRRSLNAKASESKPEFDIEEIREMVQTEVKAELARRAKLSQELTSKEFDHYFIISSKCIKDNVRPMVQFHHQNYIYIHIVSFLNFP